MRKLFFSPPRKEHLPSLLISEKCQYLSVVIAQYPSQGIEKRVKSSTEKGAT